MTTYATMRARIADEMANDGALTTNQINNAIQSAIKSYEREEWWFNVRSVFFDTIPNGEIYGSSPLDTFNDMIDVKAISCGASGTDKRPLRAVANSFIEDVQDGSVVGEPEYYTRVANRIRFYPIPNAVYRINLTYVFKLATLVEDEDTNFWVDECEELIRNGETGMLFKAGSAESLADTLLQVVAKKDLWPHLRRAGREFVEVERNWRTSVANYPKAYQSVLGLAQVGDLDGL
jgi:hypothetical protein